MSQNVPKGAKQPPTQAPRAYVRCLGPIYPEHSFWSTDRCNHRICAKCAAKIASMQTPTIECSLVLRSNKGQVEE